jgi:hypothetical protein
VQASSMSPRKGRQFDQEAGREMSTTGDPVKESGKSDATISDACTRSGAFALLISIVVCLLVPYWKARPNEIALGNYIAARFNLVLKLEDLDDNPTWQKYKSSHTAAETMSVSDPAGRETRGGHQI